MNTLPSTPENPVNALISDLIDLIYQRADTSQPLTPQAIDLLTHGAEVEAPVQRTMHAWRIVLDVCTTAPAQDRPSIEPIADKIADRLFGTTRFKEAASGAGALPVISRLVEIYAKCGSGRAARNFLAMYKSHVNRYAVTYAADQDALAARPETPLDGAVEGAFDNVDRELVVLCAEAGRLKMLASILTRHQADPTPASDRPVPSDAETIEEELTALTTDPRPTERDLTEGLHTPYQLTYEEYNQRLRALHDNHTKAEWIRALISPWRVMLATVPDHLATPDPSANADWQSWLAEPNLQSIMTGVGTQRCLLYPLFTPTWIGVVALTDDDVVSIMTTETELSEIYGKTLTGKDTHQLVGKLMASTLASFIGDRTPHLVSWSRDHTYEFEQFLIGFRQINFYGKPTDDLPSTGRSDQPPRAVELEPDADEFITIDLQPLTLPSARLLSTQEDVQRPESIVCFGDSQHDLAGPWLEEAAWRQAADDNHFSSKLGTEATKAALIEAFSAADLLILSIHARLAGRHHEPILDLADGPFSYQDILLTTNRTPAQLILSSCSAGRAASFAPQDEVVGLASSLLLRGARRVLAPSTPVNDGHAAVIGIILANTMKTLPDLRQAWSFVLALAEDAADQKNSSMGDILGDLQLNPAFPHAPLAIDRLRATPAAHLLATANRYVLYGS